MSHSSAKSSTQKLKLAHQVSAGIPYSVLQSPSREPLPANNSIQGPSVDPQSIIRDLTDHYGSGIQTLRLPQGAESEQVQKYWEALECLSGIFRVDSYQMVLQDWDFAEEMLHVS